MRKHALILEGMTVLAILLLMGGVDLGKERCNRLDFEDLILEEGDCEFCEFEFCEICDFTGKKLLDNEAMSSSSSFMESLIVREFIVDGLDMSAAMVRGFFRKL